MNPTTCIDTIRLIELSVMATTVCLVVGYFVGYWAGAKRGIAAMRAAATAKVAGVRPRGYR